MSGRVAIVTGASQGIGRATAVRLARDFPAVALVARNRANLEETAGAVRAAGAKALVVDADLRRPDAAQVVVERPARGSGGSRLEVDCRTQCAGLTAKRVSITGSSGT